MTRLGALGVGLLYAALAVGGWPGVGLAAAGAIALVGAAYTRRDGLLLLGPFAGWELVRTARRSWMHLWRPMLALAALFVTWMYVVYNTDPETGRLDQRELSQAAGDAFNMVGVCTLVLGGFFAVAHLPGVIAEEREKNRLEHLFVTDLRNRELLLGKVAGRLAVLACYAAVPVPVLSLLTLVGGVDPLTIAAVGTMYLATLFAFAGVAVACSAVSRKTSTAVLLTIGVVVGLSYLAELPTLAEDGLRSLPTGTVAELPGWVNTAREYAADACRFLAGGSPFTASDRLDAATTSGAGAADEAGAIVRAYLAGQLLVLAASWGIASRYLRRAPRPVGAAGGRTGVRAFFTRPPRHPRVSDRPIVWYDLTTPLSVFDRVGRKLLVGVWWVPALLVVPGLLAMWWLGTDEFDEWLKNLVHGSGFLAFLAVTVPVAWVGCRGIVRERERDTLDALLLTDLTPADIVRQKWLAAALSARGRVLAAIAFWATASVLQPGLLPAAVALTLVTVANAALAAAIGVWVSVRSKSGNRAFLWLAVVYAGWTIGSYFLGCFAAIPAFLGLTVVAFVLMGVLAAVNPMAVQAAAGYLGLELGTGAEVMNLVIGAIVLFGVMVAYGATVGFVRAAEGHFTRLRRPKPRRYD